jgi:large subunit ribosomal protein L29
MAGATDLAVMATEELEEHLTEYRKELFNLRFQLATGQLDNTARMGSVRREIARTLTVLREREILEAEGLYEPIETRPSKTASIEVSEAGSGDGAGAGADHGDDADGGDAGDRDDGDDEESEA